MSSSRKRHPSSEDGGLDTDFIGDSAEVGKGPSSKKPCLSHITYSNVPAEISLPDKLEDRVLLLQQDGEVHFQISNQTKEAVEPAQTNLDTPPSSTTTHSSTSESISSSEGTTNNTPSPNEAKDLALTGEVSHVPDQLQPVSTLSPKQDSAEPESGLTKNEHIEVETPQGNSVSPKTEDAGTSKDDPNPITEDMYLDLEDEDAKFERATIDDKSYVTNWTVDENSLARMPAAPQPARIKTRLLLHQLQVSSSPLL